MKTEPARGYYIGKDDIIYIWGKGNIGNCYYVPDNDEPRWAGVMYDIACQWVDGLIVQPNPPAGVPRSPPDRKHRKK